MEAALVVSMICCIWFIYKWVRTEQKCQKELFKFASAVLTANCVLDQLLEEKMEETNKEFLEFDLSPIKNHEAFAKEFSDKYNILFVDGRIRFVHLHLPIDTK